MRLLSNSAAVCMGLMLAILALLTAPRAANAETQNREVAAFQSVVLGGAGSVEISIGQNQSLVLDGDGEVLGDIKTEVRDGTLYIGQAKESRRKSLFNFSGDRSFTARITLPRLTGAAIGGSGKIVVRGLSGGTADFSVSGSGRLQAQGALAALRLTINGSGAADLKDLHADDVAVTINGSGAATIYADKALNVSINGSGTVSYLGAPAQLNKSINGSGALVKKGVASLNYGDFPTHLVLAHHGNRI